MTKKSIVALVGLSLVIGVVIGGSAIAATFTAPKDHAQALIHFNSNGQLVADHQKGFLDVSHPSTGVWCFLLPANIDPNKAILEVQIVSGYVDRQAQWYPGVSSPSCPSSAYQSVQTFHVGTSTSLVDTGFSVVVP